MKKFLLSLMLAFIPLLTFAQMDEGEYFTGDFRPNEICEFGWEGYTNFNKWKCIIPIERPLPVELISFKAKQVKSNVIKITWEYAEIKNHDFFILQHSTDARSWKLLAKQTDKSYTHKTRYVENYYRLLSVDTDGTVNTYTIIHAKAEQVPITYFDLLGRPVIAPIPGQIYISSERKKVIFIHD